MGTLSTQATDADIADGDTISTTGAMAPGFDHDDLPSDVFCDKPALPSDGGLLILSELHPVLTRMDEMPTIQRPGATSLVSSLLSAPEVTFAIVSSWRNLWVLQVVRSLLEESMPGTTWRVEEVFEGSWTSYGEAVSYSIAGNVLSTGSQEFTLGFGESCVCSVEFQPGLKTWGQLTPDGNLEWGICAEKQIWVRAGRKGPPCYVCEDDRSIRVCVFDKFYGLRPGSHQPMLRIASDAWVH